MSSGLAFSPERAGWIWIRHSLFPNCTIYAVSDEAGSRPISWTFHQNTIITSS